MESCHWFPRSKWVLLETIQPYMCRFRPCPFMCLFDVPASNPQHSPTPRDLEMLLGLGLTYWWCRFTWNINSCSHHTWPRAGNVPENCRATACVAEALENRNTALFCCEDISKRLIWIICIWNVLNMLLYYIAKAFTGKKMQSICTFFELQDQSWQMFLTTAE